MRSLLGGGGGRVRGGRERGGLSVLLLHLVFCLLLLVGAALGDPRAAASPDSPHQSIQVQSRNIRGTSHPLFT